MLHEKEIEQLRMRFIQNNYVMTTAELLEARLYYADIKQLLDEGFIERVRRGYYHWTQDDGESEIVIINRLFPDAVLCMETALACFLTPYSVWKLPCFIIITVTEIHPNGVSPLTKMFPSFGRILIIRSLRHIVWKDNC